MSFVIGPLNITAAGGATVASVTGIMVGDGVDVYASGSSLVISSNAVAGASQYLSAQTGVVGNVGGGTDPLMSYTAPAATLSNNLDTLIVEGHGDFGGNGGLKTLGFEIAGTNVLNEIGDAGLDNDPWNAYIRIVRLSATELQVYSRGDLDGGGGAFFDEVLNVANLDSNTLLLEFQGTHSLGTTDEVQQYWMGVRKISAP